MEQDNGQFWRPANDLIAASNVVTDRPRGSRHPRYPHAVYPLSYGYLDGTRSGDGDGIDVWLGSDLSQFVTGVLVTIDAAKGDAELKLRIGRTEEEAQSALAFQRGENQASLLILAPVSFMP